MMMFDHSPATLTGRLFSLLSRGLLALVAILTLSACGGGGADTQSLPNTGSVTSSNYNGPPPATDDVQLFKLNVWDNLVADNRCGACHGSGGQSPAFVRSDDINLAYTAANNVVNLASPSDSTMVSKVAGGHNCWLSSDQACADTITQYITRWAGGSTGERQRVVLEPVSTLNDPGTTNILVDNSANYSDLYNLFTGAAQCNRCHSRDSNELSQTPYFADNTDQALAFEAAKSKIDVNNPELSRFYARLKNDSHNCWSNCDDDASDVLALINALPVSSTSLPSGTLASKVAPRLPEGTPANTGGRYESNIIAKWEFKTGEGTTAFDTSGIEPAINLNLLGDVSWVGGWGIRLIDGKAQGSTTSSRKLYDLIRSTGEYTVEAWVAPGNVSQEGPAVIIGYGGSDTRRNFTLGQTLYNYDFLHRSSTTDLNGDPAISTPDDDEVLQATLQHVAITFSPTTGRRIYVNGRLTDAAETASIGNLNDWDDTFAFVIGSEPSGFNQWQGTVRMAAVHNRALTDAQIRNNYDVGVGQKYYLMFSISHLINLPESYIVFEVSQFDSFSYLFNAPFFISLDPDAVPQNISISGMRIGVNSEEADAGQAYITLNQSELDAAYYDSENGQQLSDVGTIIRLKSGPEVDQFFLLFEELNGNSGVVSAPPTTVDQLAITPAANGQPRIGTRNFNEISASMAKLTGVPESRVAANYDDYSEFLKGLPAGDDPMAFAPAHQMAITQLSFQFCSELVDDTGLRSTKLPNTNFTGADYSSSDRSDLIDDLSTAFVGNGFSLQPTNGEVTTAMNTLIDELATDCSGVCNTAQTELIVKASCSAVLGSAAMMVQ